MNIRRTTVADIPEAAKIYDNARTFMRQSGNMQQWSSGRPNAEDIEKDIKDGTSYVCEDNGEIIGVFFFNVADDPTYKIIYEGRWLSNEPYAVMHRIAVKYHGRGIADYIYSYCFKMWANIRIDTHKDNLPMQKSLKKNGFKYCGIIYLENGEERMAFQKS